MNPLLQAKEMKTAEEILRTSMRDFRDFIEPDSDLEVEILGAMEKYAHQFKNFPMESKAEPSKEHVINFALEAIARHDELKSQHSSEPLFAHENEYLTIGELYDEFGFSPPLSNEVREVSDEEITKLWQKFHNADKEGLAPVRVMTFSAFKNAIRSLFSNKLVVKDGFEEWLILEIELWKYRMANCDLVSTKSEFKIQVNALEEVLGKYRKLQPKGNNKI